MRTYVSIIAATLLATLSVAQAQSRVWVQPFTEVNENQPADWINRALHQALVDELAANGAQVVAGPAKPADVQYVVSGKIQRIDGELRVTGQITDASSDKTVGGFKATGSERQLFAIEDSIGQQVSKAVGAEPKVAVATAPAQAAAGAAPRIETPFAPVRFGFEGSDLQDAVRRDRPIEPRPVIRYETPVYPQQPLYPANYGGGYYPPYGGYFGHHWGFNTWPSVIIVKPGHGGHGGHGGSGGGNTGVPADNGQAIRAVSGYGGRTPPPGVIHTMGGTPGISHTVRPSAPGVIHTR